jgi:H+-transporting ATPase
VLAVIGAQTIATVIAVAGILVTPLPWYWALAVWGYAIGWFLVTDRIKLLAYQMLDADRSASVPKAGPSSERDQVDPLPVAAAPNAAA